MKLATSNIVIFYCGQQSKTFQSKSCRSSISAPLSRTLRTCSSLSWKSWKSQNQNTQNQKKKPGKMLKLIQRQETLSEFAKLWAGEPKSGRWLGEAGEAWPLGNEREHVQTKTDRKWLKAKTDWWLFQLVGAPDEQGAESGKNREIWIKHTQERAQMRNDLIFDMPKEKIGHRSWVARLWRFCPSTNLCCARAKKSNVDATLPCDGNANGAFLSNATSGRSNPLERRVSETKGQYDAKCSRALICFGAIKCI